MSEYGCEIGLSTGGNTSTSSNVKSSLMRGRSPDALTSGMASAILENLEGNFIGRKFNAGLFIDPCANFPKGRHQEIQTQMRFIGQREVEVFREAIGFEVALFEASAAFENPAISQRQMLKDSGKQPTKNIVLFDHVRQQAKISCACK
jgi:hypothetical protein